ncbi:MAG: PASTA domain-containing protein [Halospina sp.]
MLLACGLPLAEPAAALSRGQDLTIAQRSVEPPPELQLRPNRTQQIRLVVVPDLGGLLLEEAEQRLARLKLVLGPVERRESEARQEGRVLQQNPGPRVRVEPGTAVGVWIGEGPGRPPEEELVVVPDLSGLPLEEASQLLADVDLSVVEEGSEGSEQLPTGTVLRQEPAAGEQVPPETVVRVWLAKSGTKERFNLLWVVGLAALVLAAALLRGRGTKQVGARVRMQSISDVGEQDIAVQSSGSLSSQTIRLHVRQDSGTQTLMPSQPDSPENSYE